MSSTIWIIDDDPGILEVTEIVLIEAGYNVKVVNDVSILEDLLKESKPDLILLDILMSGFDGRDIAKKLKGNDETKNIPIIMMSADTHIEQKAQEGGADTYLRKPFDITDLETIVKRYVH